MCNYPAVTGGNFIALQILDEIPPKKKQVFSQYPVGGIDHPAVARFQSITQEFKSVGKIIFDCFQNNYYTKQALK